MSAATMVFLLSVSALVASIAARNAQGLDAPNAARWLSWSEKFDPLNARWPALAGAGFEEQARAGNAAAWPLARVAYDRSKKMEPRVAQYASNLGRVLAALSDAELSEAAFNQALRLAPLDARIRLDAAEASLNLGRMTAAEQQLTEILSRWPSWGPPWWVLAELRSRQNRTVEERGALEAGLRADWFDWPEGADASRLRLAFLLGNQGDFEGARSLFARPVESAPDICGAPRKMN